MYRLINQNKKIYSYVILGLFQELWKCNGTLQIWKEVPHENNIFFLKNSPYYLIYITYYLFWICHYIKWMHWLKWIYFKKRGKSYLVTLLSPWKKKKGMPCLNNQSYSPSFFLVWSNSILVCHAWLNYLLYVFHHEYFGLTQEEISCPCFLLRIDQIKSWLNLYVTYVFHHN